MTASVWNPATPIGVDLSSLGFTQLGTGAVLQDAQDKVRSIQLSVVDFGVDMTGASLSDEALQVAIAAAEDLTSGGKGAVLDIPNGVIALSEQVVVPSRVKLQGRGPRATIINSSYAGYAFLFDTVDFSGISGCRIGLTSNAAAGGIAIRTTLGSTRWCSFEDLFIAGATLSGQVGFSMVASGGNIITECLTKYLSTFLVDRPVVIDSAEGNFFLGLSLDSFGISVARSAIESVGLVNFIQARVAGAPTAGSVGLSEAGFRNLIDLVVDIGASSTALNDTGTGNIIRLQRPELLTPVGTYSARTTLIDSEFFGVRRVLQRGGAVTSGAFALSAGWGTTASVGSISGHDGFLKFTVTSAGTGQAANPTIVYTFVDGAFPSAPMVQITRDGGNQPTVGTFSSSTNTTTWQTAWGGTPVAGETYTFIVKVG